MYLRRFLFSIIACFALGPPLMAQQVVTGTITGSSCVQIDVTGKGVASISVTNSASGSAWSGTIQPQVAIGGDPAQNTSVYPTGSTTSQSTITANNVYQSVSVSGATLFQVCGNTVTNTANIKLTAVPLSGRNGGGGGGGGGSGTVATGTPPELAVYTAANTVTGDSTASDNGTTFAVTSTGGVSAPQYTSPGIFKAFSAFGALPGLPGANLSEITYDLLGQLEISANNAAFSPFLNVANFSSTQLAASFGVGGGTANAQTVTHSTNPVAACTNGLLVSWVPTAGNTGAATLSDDSCGPVSVIAPVPGIGCAGACTSIPSGIMNTVNVAVAEYVTIAATGYFELLSPTPLASGVAWTALTNGVGNLSIAPGGTSIFNATSSVTQFFAFKNTTAALVGTPQSSPTFAMCGTEWVTGPASGEGCLSMQFLPTAGLNAGGTFSFTHTGTGTGAYATTFPGSIASATSGGIGSALFLTAEGTVPAALSTSAQDNCYADSTQHGILCNFNAGTTLPLLQGPVSDTTNTLAKFSGTNGGKVVGSTITDNGTTVSTTEPLVATTYDTCPDSSGSGTAQVCNTTPTFTVVTGSCITYTTTTANTGAGLTLNVNSLGAKSVAKWQGATTLTANDVLANKQVQACYDGTNWELASIGNAPGGAVSSVNTLTGAVVIEAATAGQMAVSGGNAAALTGAADMTYATHTFSTITTGIFDWSAATGVASLKFPAVAGGTALAGTVTANLSAPIQLINTNSTNNNTSIGAIIGSAGTSTGGIGELVFDVSGTGDIWRAYSGGSVASGVYTVGTLEAELTATGGLALGGATVPTLGTGAAIVQTAAGTCPTLVANSTDWCNLTGVSNTFNVFARTSGVVPYFQINIPADTAQTAATESPGFVTNTATRTWATTGTVALQRENFFAGPTYASASASQTFTDAFTLYATPPIAGSNAIFTRGHTLGIVDATSAASAITGAVVVAQTLGTAATSVGIGGGNVNAGGSLTAGSNVTAPTQTITGTSAGSPGVVDKTIGVTTAAMGTQATNAAVNITGMTWSTANSKNYLLQCDVPVTLTSTATLAFSLANSSGNAATSYSLVASGLLGAAGVYGQLTALAQTAFGTKTTTSSATANTTLVHVWAFIQNAANSGGTLTLQTWDVAAAGTIQVLANSTCSLTQQN